MSNRVESPTEPTPSVQLMVHAQDGTFPFLTPLLISKCFPPRPELRIGIAVRDTCVRAIIRDEETKPRGYTFSPNVTPDPWMVPYSRVTVPTFDLEDDVASFSRKKNAELAVTQQHVPLWTSNGRQPITPSLHADCAKSLGSTVSVPLFDMIPALSLTRDASTGPPAVPKKRNKRIQAAVQRNELWTRSTAKEIKGSTWAPLAVASDAQPKDDEFNRILEIEGVDGIALAGWHHIVCRDLRLRILKAIAHHEMMQSKTVAVLSTSSLAQILQLIAHGSQISNPIVIGSDLPAIWARSKRAFVCGIDVITTMENGDDDAADGLGRRSKKRPRETKVSLDDNGCVDINRAENHPWFQDRRPLVVGCTCMACQSHSRAFLYHLVCSKELLAEILLYIHNLHHLLSLIRITNTMGKDGDDVASYCRRILAHLQS